MKFHKILWETPESCKFAATLKKCRPCTAVKYRVSSIRAKRIGDEEHANARKNRISKGTLAQSICRCPAGAVVCTGCAVCHRARLDEAVEGAGDLGPVGSSTSRRFTPFCTVPPVEAAELRQSCSPGDPRSHFRRRVV